MANPFEKKTWQNRLSQYPTRRTLTDVDTNEVTTVDFARAEGQIYTEGDGFTAANMNDLEDRIEAAFETGSSDSTINIPRKVHKNVTAQYDAGEFTDVRPGDYFTISRVITSPYDRTADEISSDTNPNIRKMCYGTNTIIILDIEPDVTGAPAMITCAPCEIEVSQFTSYSRDIKIGTFGRCNIAKSSLPIVIGNMTDYWAQITDGTDTASTEDSATIVAQLKAEFGDGLRFYTVNIPDSLNSSGNVNGTTSKTLQFVPFTDAELVGYTQSVNDDRPGRQINGGSHQLALFRYQEAQFVARMHNIQTDTYSNQPIPMLTRNIANNHNVGITYSGSIASYKTANDASDFSASANFLPISGKFLLQNGRF